jgi:hypothetical protein
MSGERRTILALMAAGRISASEAERLLRLANDARQELWIIAAVLMVCAAQLHLRIPLDGLGHLVEEMMRTVQTGGNAIGHAITNAAGALLSKGMGGSI